jgi:hypothetical protein
MQSSQDLGNTFVRSWELLSGNWAIALPAVIIGIVGGVILHFVMIVFMGGGALVAGLAGLFLGGLIMLAVSTVLQILTVAFTTGMGIAAWRTGTASVADGSAVFSNPGAMQTIILWMVIGVVLALIPVLGWIADAILMFLLIYAVPASVVSGVGGMAAFSESANVVGRNFVPTLIIIVLIFCIGIVGGIVGAVLGHIPFLGNIIQEVIRQVIMAYGTLVICGEYLKVRAAMPTVGAPPVSGP